MDPSAFSCLNLSTVPTLDCPPLRPFSVLGLVAPTRFLDVDCRGAFSGILNSFNCLFCLLGFVGFFSTTGKPSNWGIFFSLVVLSTISNFFFKLFCIS